MPWASLVFPAGPAVVSAATQNACILITLDKYVDDLPPHSWRLFLAPSSNFGPFFSFFLPIFGNLRLSLSKHVLSHFFLFFFAAYPRFGRFWFFLPTLWPYLPVFPHCWPFLSLPFSSSGWSWSGLVVKQSAVGGEGVFCRKCMLVLFPPILVTFGTCCYFWPASVHDTDL